jgi:hypothetical protein
MKVTSKYGGSLLNWYFSLSRRGVDRAAEYDRFYEEIHNLRKPEKPEKPIGPFCLWPKSIIDN